MGFNGTISELDNAKEHLVMAATLLPEDDVRIAEIKKATETIKNIREGIARSALYQISRRH